MSSIPFLTRQQYQEQQRDYDCFMVRKGYFFGRSIVSIEILNPDFSINGNQLGLAVTKDQLQKINLAALQKLETYPALQRSLLDNFRGTLLQGQPDATELHDIRMQQEPIRSIESTAVAKLMKSAEGQINKSQALQATYVDEAAKDTRQEHFGIMAQAEEEQVKALTLKNEELKNEKKKIKASEITMPSLLKKLKEAIDSFIRDPSQDAFYDCFFCKNRALQLFPNDLRPYYPIFFRLASHMREDDLKGLIKEGQDIDYHLTYACIMFICHYYWMIKGESSKAVCYMLKALSSSYPKDNYSRQLVALLSDGEEKELDFSGMWESLDSAYSALCSKGPLPAATILHNRSRMNPGMAVIMRFMALSSLVAKNYESALKLYNDSKKLIQIASCFPFSRAVNDVCDSLCLDESSYRHFLYKESFTEEVLLESVIKKESKSACTLEDLYLLLVDAYKCLEKFNGWDYECLVYVDIGYRLILAKVLTFKNQDNKALLDEAEKIKELLQNEGGSQQIVNQKQSKSIREKIVLELNLLQGCFGKGKDHKIAKLKHPLLFIRTLDALNASSSSDNIAQLIEVYPLLYGSYFGNESLLDFTLFFYLHKVSMMTQKQRRKSEILRDIVKEYYPFIQDAMITENCDLEVVIAFESLRNRSMKSEDCNENNLFSQLLAAYRYFAPGFEESQDAHLKRLQDAFGTDFIAPNILMDGAFTFKGMQAPIGERNIIPEKELTRVIYLLMANFFRDFQKANKEHNEKIAHENQTAEVQLDEWLEAMKKNSNEPKYENLQDKRKHMKIFEKLKKDFQGKKVDREFLLRKISSILTACEEKRDYEEHDFYVENEADANIIYRALLDISFFRLLRHKIAENGPDFWCFNHSEESLLKIKNMFLEIQKELRDGFHGPERHLVGKGPLQQHFNALVFNSSMGSNNVHIFFGN